MNRIVPALVLLGLLALPEQAPAKICTIDAVPAATLLLPYFEVSCPPLPSGTRDVTTLFSVNNSSEVAVLAHVVVWSDLSVPVLDFNIYLTGYDVQTADLRGVLCDGLLPQTASRGQDPADTISPQGTASQDINFASCTGQLPPPQMSADFVEHLKRSLTGETSSVLGGRCAGQAFGDNILRGYVTVDTVNNCTLRFAGDAGYFFSGGTGDATNQNVLLGDYFYLEGNPITGNYAEGETLVHIEADATDPETSVAGEYTFYGRYVAWTAADNREPLSSTFFVRFLNKPAADFTSDLIVWRDPKINQGAFTCPALLGVRPPWYPLNRESIVAFDEEEQASIPDGQSPVPLPFAAAASRTRVGGADLRVKDEFGWLYLNLSSLVLAAGPNPPEDPEAAQAWVTAIMRHTGARVSAGFDAFQLDNTCTANHVNPEP
jgi:hypothetical protein